jgi:hypothetical protein
MGRHADEPKVRRSLDELDRSPHVGQRHAEFRPIVPRRNVRVRCILRDRPRVDPDADSSQSPCRDGASLDAAISSTLSICTAAIPRAAPMARSSSSSVFATPL